MVAQVPHLLGEVFTRLSDGEFGLECSLMFVRTDLEDPHGSRVHVLHFVSERLVGVDLVLVCYAQSRTQSTHLTHAHPTFSSVLRKDSETTALGASLIACTCPPLLSISHLG